MCKASCAPVAAEARLLRPTDPAAVAPLFAGWPEYLFRAALDGCMGEVVANESVTAARIDVAGFGFLAGDAACPEAAALALHLPATHRGEAFIVPRDGAWSAVVAAAWGSRARLTQRYAIRKDAHRFHLPTLAAYAATLPEGFWLAAMDASLYARARAEAWSADLVGQFADSADFVARGLGVMALYGDEPVAGAASFVVFRGGIEIEIDTRPEYRRRGLATACGAQLMLTCFTRGLYPSWDAHNPASVALAQKLGYIAAQPYATYVVDAPAQGGKPA